MSSVSSLRTAEIIAVGSELLGSTRLDTNSLYIAERLAGLGIELHAKAVVGDDRADIAAMFREALVRTDLVIFTGGLGPTDDDLTREVVADVLGLPLSIDDSIVKSIEQRFARRGMKMPPVNVRQAQVPHGAEVLANPNGTAPGLLIRHDGHLIVLLPGPPREVNPMIDALCAGPLLECIGTERLYRARLFVAGRSESSVEEAAQPLYSKWRDETPPIATTILASPGQVELHLTIRDPDREHAQVRLRHAQEDLHRAVGEDVFSTDGRLLEEIVGEHLVARGYRIAAAESCTGGLLMARLTDVPGSSRYVHAAVVSYDNEAKIDILKVPRALIEQHGAVSEPVAVAMAEGVRALTGAEVAVAITGIAGPGGGTPTKPVGTVVIAILIPEQPAFVRTFSFVGGRSMVRTQAAQAAMDRVRRLLQSSAR
jgi:nicotinamide-nucleotide amidase